MRNLKVKLNWERADDHVFFFKVSHVLITCCCIVCAGSNCAFVSRSGYIWIWSEVRDQESTNHNARFTEWKSRYTTIELTLIQWNANKLRGIPQLSLRVDAFLLIVQCTGIFNSPCSFDVIITFACADKQSWKEDPIKLILEGLFNPDRCSTNEVLFQLS